MIRIRSFEVIPLPMVTKQGKQRVDIRYHSSRAAHGLLSVYKDGEAVVRAEPVALNSGKGRVTLMLPQQQDTFHACWMLEDQAGHVLARTEADWVKPRQRTIYVMISSHTDIGLHNSQYIQRSGSVRLLDKAVELCRETAPRKENDRYRYTMEGTWFWNNYGLDRGEAAAKSLVEQYLKPGDLGVCCGIAGNHFQTFGLEQMCRATYERRRLKDAWGIDSRTMAIIDVNGFPMSMLQPYAESGVENIIFAPNHWNPIPSTVWEMDMTKEGIYLNPDAGGGGSRVDVRYDSELPMVFYWQNRQGDRILVWASTQYGYGGASFGLFPNRKLVPETIPFMEERMAGHLPLMEQKYPYDVWLFACYDDDSQPDLEVTNSIRAWNEKWEWPKLRTLGDPDEPFRILRQKHGGQIPVLQGDITGGWYQHPVAAPELLARKFETDRLLPTAEKWSAVAAMLDEDYGYPAQDFRRAWDHLLFNDEHSYGTSGYQGRRVYETWLQHRDWIDRAQAVARQENDRALEAIAGRISVGEESVAVFNPTTLERKEQVWLPDGTGATVDVPAFGYRVVEKSAFRAWEKTVDIPDGPPVVENRYYRIAFGENGSMVSIFDKDQGRELLDRENSFRGNELVYTDDGHKHFYVPEKAAFEVIKEGGRICVVARTALEKLGAETVQTVTLQDHEKRIDVDNRLHHARAMVNNRRYYRYLYVAFPFAVENCRRYCHLNGTVAEYAKDVTGHGTDVYMAVNEWCCAENDRHGTALMMLDSTLIEFDHIHPDKTDFGAAGEGSQMFAYVANDWLQMHTPGGSHLDFRFRYAITSYEGACQQAKVPEMARRYTQPVQPVLIPAQAGTLNGEQESFLRLDRAQRLVGLKRADDGDGLIARVYGAAGEVPAVRMMGQTLLARRVRIDETPMEEAGAAEGFATYRLGAGAYRLKERLPEQKKGENGGPAPVGSCYTGLVGEPCAARGEDPGQLYLLWGRSMEPELDHYELFRSEEPGFAANEQTLVAKICQEEEYAVGRYVDTGLKEHTCYYYRVCAVDRQGRRSELSREFGGYTKESL